MSQKKAGILVFPGTNCDFDLKKVLEQEYGFATEFLWHTNSFQIEHDIYFLPGGFSYGDYLRSGAMASRSLSISSLQQAAEQGRQIAGICNGFQVLTESHLLPGALVKNNTLKHIARWVDLKGAAEFQGLPEDYALPVSHSEGNYLCDDDILKSLHDDDLILFYYKEDVNGSREKIAGIKNRAGNVWGLMPHPERAIFSVFDNPVGSKGYGRLFFEKLFEKL